MSDQNPVNVYDSQGNEYSRAFGVFLAHTDQKAKATAWLEQEVNGLANREVFIDAGAGTGKLTGWLEPRFRQTIAIEPNVIDHERREPIDPFALREVLGAIHPLHRS